MTETDPLLRAESMLRGALNRAWVSLRRPSAPDYTTAEPDLRELRWRRLGRVRDALEQTRTILARDGFTSGAWFSIQVGDDVRQVSTAEAYGLRDPCSSVVSACLIGTLVRVAEDPDTVPTVADAWRCVDELYEAMHEQLGHSSLPAGRCSSHNDRRVKVRVLTAWNDAPGRTLAQVEDLVDRAISRTILAACG